MPKIYSVFDSPPAVDTSFIGESLTQQSFLEESNINTIISKYQTTGLLVDPLVSSTLQPQFADFTNVTDFHSAQIMLSNARESFAMLPASIRKRFDNDPGLLLAFLDDENNREEAFSLGLIPQNGSTPTRIDPSTIPSGDA